MTKIKCVCPGTKLLFGPPTPCGRDATQEDLLCDHCRVMDCPTVTTLEEARRRQQMQRNGQGSVPSRSVVD